MAGFVPSIILGEYSLLAGYLHLYLTVCGWWSLSWWLDALSLSVSLSYTPSLSLSRYLSFSLFKLATVSLSISTIQFRNANAHASVLQNNAPKIMAADSLFGAQNHPHDVNYSLNIFWWHIIAKKKINNNNKILSDCFICGFLWFWFVLLFAWIRTKCAGDFNMQTHE